MSTDAAHTTHILPHRYTATQIYRPYKITMATYSGVLPYTFAEHKLVFMLGWCTETRRWMDFCGTANRGETHEETAARYWWSSTLGCFGSKDTYLELIRLHGIKVILSPEHVIYLVRMAYKPDVLTTYTNICAHVTTLPAGAKTTLQWLILGSTSISETLNAALSTLKE